MEIEEKQDRHKIYLNINPYTILTFTGVTLLILTILYFFYLIEKYLLFLTIYKSFILLLKLSGFYSIKFTKILQIFSILLVIHLHFVLFRSIILSFVFLSGGLGARFMFYNHFKVFIKGQKEHSQKMMDYLLFMKKSNSILDKLLYHFGEIVNFQKAFNNQKMTKKRTMEIKQYHFSESLNEIVFNFNKLKEKNFKNKDFENSVINNLKLYQENLEPYLNFSSLDVLTKFFYYDTLDVMGYMLLTSFGGREVKFIPITKNFEVTVISPKIILEGEGGIKEEKKMGIISERIENLKEGGEGGGDKKEKNEKNGEKVKTLVIFCHQNALNIEIFSIFQDNIKIYLRIPDSTIIIWNYPGFGSRGGNITTFDAIDKDINLFCKYIQKEFYDYKIIIHGISIGGYAAIKLAKCLNENNENNNNKNVCLIADRTYSDIDLIAKSYTKYGYILKNLYNVFFPKFIYHSDNVKNYIEVPIGNKIICFDENDEIISYNPSSLIYNLSNKYFEEILLPKISHFKQFSEIYNIEENKNKNYLELIKTEVKKLSLNYYEGTFDVNTTIFLRYLNQEINKNLKDFIKFFLIFGFPFNKFKEISYDKKKFAENFLNLPKIMKKIGKHYQNKFSINLISFISKLNFLFIQANLVTDINEEDLVSFNWNDEEKGEEHEDLFRIHRDLQENLMKYFGYIHRIFCGHNGRLNINDEQYLLKYFEINGFVNKIDENKNINNIFKDDGNLFSISN